MPQRESLHIIQGLFSLLALTTEDMHEFTSGTSLLNLNGDEISISPAEDGRDIELFLGSSYARIIHPDLSVCEGTRDYDSQVAMHGVDDLLMFDPQVLGGSFSVEAASPVPASDGLFLSDYDLVLEPVVRLSSMQCSPSRRDCSVWHPANIPNKSRILLAKCT